MKKYKFLLTFLFLGLSISFNAQAVIDTNAPTVQLRKDCNEAGGTLNNCFTTMTAVVDWINNTRHPDAASPLLVNVGPGQFSTFNCNNSGYTTLQGSGRTNTIIGDSTTDYFGIAISNCTNLDFKDLSVTKKLNAFNTINWSGGGTSTWTNVDVDGSSYAWVDNSASGNANDCVKAERSKHFWFNSRLTTKTDVGIVRGYISHCAESWFFGSEITGTVTGSTSITEILAVSNDSEAHVYGSVIRLVVADGFSQTYGMNVVKATNNAEVHIHGTGIDAISDSANTISVLIAETGGKIHANESSYNLTTGAGGTMTRIANNGGTINAPYQWQNSTLPPTIVSANGADTYVEGDCSSSGCQTSGTETHLLIYNSSCTGAGGTWFDVVTGSCR